MALWFSWISLWISLNILFRNVAAQQISPLYTIHHSHVRFDQATAQCSPGSVTTLATKDEVAKILGLIARSVSPVNQNNFTFWVGLRKVKNECVAATLPLRGFKWTEDGSDVSEVSRWAEEPELTCTTDRCAVLKGQLNGSEVTGWGLVPVSCKISFQFICKVRDSSTGGTLKPPELPAPEQKSAAPKLVRPDVEPAPEPKTAAPVPHRPKPTPQIKKTEAPEPPATEPNTKPKPENGPDSDSGSEPELKSALCQRPSSSFPRSFILDPDDRKRIQVECWSLPLVELHCSGWPAAWRLPDGSVANFSTICDPCDDGFQKDISGKCKDIDECSSTPCRRGCVNTEGSYRCICSDDNGELHNEDSPLCKDTAVTDDHSLMTGVLLPVLVSVAALVVLLVLIAVMVKCCLMRRSKRRAIKKAEKMAMESQENKNSFGTANKKAAV